MRRVTGPCLGYVACGLCREVGFDNRGDKGMEGRATTCEELGIGEDRLDGREKPKYSLTASSISERSLRRFEGGEGGGVTHTLSGDGAGAGGLLISAMLCRSLSVLSDGVLLRFRHRRIRLSPEPSSHCIS